MYDLLARISRTLPPFRGKGRLASNLHRALSAGAIGEEPLREVTMHDGSRAKWDLRDEAEAMAYWLGEADDDVRSELLKRVPADATVLDVGANVGWWTVPLARALAPKGGRVIAFEPVPDNRARLEWAIQANRVQRTVQVVAEALGEHEGELGMWLKSSQTGAGSGTAALVTNAEGDSHLKVRVTTLDHWATEQSITRCDLIKLDIEGAELMMLRGAEQFIAKHKPLIFGEFESYWLSTFGASFLDVAEWATRMGYRMERWDNRRGEFEPVERAAVGIQDVLLVPS